MSEYTFTNAGATGRTGPSQNDVDTEYEETPLHGDVTVLGPGVQKWEPPDGSFTITVSGAEGAPGADSQTGKGAIIKGEIEFDGTETLYILVGQQGTQEATSDGNPGGGGTFIVKEVSSSQFEIQDVGPVEPLFVAGGGGGSWDNSPPDHWDGRTWHDGTAGGEDSGDGGSGEGAGGGFTGTGNGDGSGDVNGGSFLYGYQGDGEDGVSGDGEYGIGGDPSGGFGGGGGFGSYNYGSPGGGMDGGDFVPYGESNGVHDPDDWQHGGGSFVHESIENVSTSDGYFNSTLDIGLDETNVGDLGEFNEGHGEAVFELNIPDGPSDLRAEVIRFD